MVENVVVAVGISLVSYSVTEIQSTSGVLVFSASHLMSAKTENHSIKLELALFGKFCTKTLKYVSLAPAIAGDCKIDVRCRWDWEDLNFRPAQFGNRLRFVDQTC